MTAPDVTILPGQAARISREAAKTGAAVGVSQSGSALIIDTGRQKLIIGPGGADVDTNPNQEQLPC